MAFEAWGPEGSIATTLVRSDLSAEAKSISIGTKDVLIRTILVESDAEAIVLHCLCNKWQVPTHGYDKDEIRKATKKFTGASLKHYVNPPPLLPTPVKKRQYDYGIEGGMFQEIALKISAEEMIAKQRKLKAVWMNEDRTNF